MPASYDANPASGKPFIGAPPTVAETSSNRSLFGSSYGAFFLSDTMDNLEKRASFLSGLFVAFKEQICTDILLKPNEGPCIPAHKALLAARSEIFKNILDSDSCNKTSPSDKDTITLSELNSDELESLLEILYTGNLPGDKFKKHLYSLYVAADKYVIPYLYSFGFTDGLMDTMDDFRTRASFLSEFFGAFKEQIHTDILLKPNDGPCIPAHKALLAARSEIFKNALELESEALKAPPSDTDTITLSELNTEELESFLEFLYTGNLPIDKLKKHVNSLYVAADKYEIPYLQELCDRYLLHTLNTSNALEILEALDAHPNSGVKKTTLKFIVANMEEIVSTKKYEDFVFSNPHLSLRITRAFVDDSDRRQRKFQRTFGWAFD